MDLAFSWFLILLKFLPILILGKIFSRMSPDARQCGRQQDRRGRTGERGEHWGDRGDC